MGNDLLFCSFIPTFTKHQLDTIKHKDMNELNTMSLSEYLYELMRVADSNKRTPLDTSSNPIELNWDWYSFYGWIGEDRYTQAHLALCDLGYTFDNYKG